MKMNKVVRAKQSGGGARRLGFSLLELLLVMAVVGVLASLLLVAISKARSKARLAACQNNFRQLVTAWRLYADDYQGRLVNNVHLDQTNSWVWGSVSKFGEGGVTNTQFLVGEEALFAPYVSTSKTCHCPAEEICGMGYWRDRSVGVWGWACGGADWAGDFRSSAIDNTDLALAGKTSALMEFGGEFSREIER